MFGYGPFGKPPFGAVSAKRDQAVGTITAEATVDGVGQTRFSGVGAAAGATTVSGAGQTRNAGAGAAAGSTVVAGAGRTRNAAAGTVAATSSAAGTIRGRTTGAGAVSAASTAAATARSRNATVGAAAGAATPVGVGAYRFSGEGATTGAAAVDGVGQTRNATVGAAAGAATLYGYARQGQGRGVADGASTAQATGQTRASGVGAATSTSTPAAVGISRLRSAGSSAGAATAAATGRTRNAAAGAATSAATVAATGRTRASAAGSVSAAATVAGTVRGRATGAGAVAGSTSVAATARSRMSVVGQSNGMGSARGYILTVLPGSGIKRSGVVFPSYGREALWSSTSPFDVDFPATNLSLLDEVRRVAVRSDTAETVIDFLLPATRQIDMVALVQHNGSAAAFFAIQLSSGTNPATDLVHESGQVPVWESAIPVSGYLPTRPYRLSAPVGVRSGRITLGVNTAPWEIGAIELGLFWSWLDVAVDREIGFDSRALVQNAAPGIDHVTAQWSPRTARGSRRVVDQDEVDGRLLDFQHFTAKSTPFLWCWDVDDPATWAREAWLARNRSLVGGVVTDHGAGTMAYDFMEHLR